jgi:isoquinoline 1-oxidoreductase beta subunit
VEQTNFSDYRLLTMAECPRIEVYLLPQGGRPGGIGEPGVPPPMPALANAIYQLTGQRLRRLPIGNQLA